MNDKIKDFIFWAIVALTLGGIIFLVTRPFFLDFAKEYPLLGGFIKFFFLASYGDLIATRIKNKEWKLPVGFLLKAIVWGLIGIVIVVIFGIFTYGVSELQLLGVLPSGDGPLLTAFFISLIMNFTFAPTMMTAHRISDSYIEQRKFKVPLSEVIRNIDFAQFFKFTVLRTIPLFWVPAHTITFLLPDEYRVIFAAVLGIFLGLILGLFRTKGEEVKV